MRIVHICAGLEKDGGGLTDLISSLAHAQVDEGDCVSLVFTRGADPVVSLEWIGGGVHSFSRHFPKFLFFSWELLLYLPGIVRGADVVHVHSSWTFPVWYGAFTALLLNKKLVMAPHGSLDPVRLRHSAWKKCLVGWLDRFCLRRADLIHVLSEMEKTWCLAFARNVRCAAVLPCGVNGPGVQRFNKKSDPRRVVYLGRLHPLKGVDLLIDAWKDLFDVEAVDWCLVIAGPEEQGCLANLKKQAEHRSDVVFAPAVYGDAKWRFLQEASVCVLPTRSENFGIVVGEALACGTPVVVTRAAPWEGVQTHLCGAWCEISADALAGALRWMISLSDAERIKMGERGREWICREFTWKRAAKRMNEAYRMA